MKVVVLGSGTSHGVPVIGCDCAVCRSDHPKNQRTRCSLWLQYGEWSVLIDAATELRLQALREGIRQVHAVLLTHAHADHISGMDDLRIFSQRSKQELPVYGNEETLREIRRKYSYVFEPTQEGGGKPKFSLHPINGPFDLFGQIVVPIPAWHGELPVLGFRLGGFAYVTDVSRIPSESLARLQGLDTLILGALRHRPHVTHFNVAQALEIVTQLQPRQTYFTHICHDLEHETTNADLPAGVELAYDGLALEFPEAAPPPGGTAG